MNDEMRRNLVALCAMALTAAGCSGGTAMRAETPVGYRDAEVGYTATTEAPPTGAPSRQGPSVQYHGDGSGGEVAADSMAPPPSMAPAPTTPGSMAMGRVAPEREQQRAEPDPTYRPGLGTEFGERRSSPINFMPFDRASAAPFATVALNYNDGEGVAAMVSHERARGAAMGPVGIDPRGELTVSVVDEAGRALSAMNIGGRIYVIGAAGSRYAIHVHNNGPRRFELVASVDGLDVMDGREASFNKRGYIAAPYQSFVIDGFRTSAAEVAAFRFGSVRSSYAARTGSARNVGVIGVALFSEQGVAYWDESEIRLRQNADPFPGRFSQAP